MVLKKLSLNVVGESNDENNFPHKLLLTNAQFLKLRKAFANGSSFNIKLSKTQLHKIGQTGKFLGRLLGPLIKTGLPLIGNVRKPLAKSVLIPLGLQQQQQQQQQQMQLFIESFLIWSSFGLNFAHDYINNF